MPPPPASCRTSPTTGADSRCRRRRTPFRAGRIAGHRRGSLAGTARHPTVLVTGSNGKTTTVRLLAACARAHGWHTGYNCTDGVFLDAEALATGDYSGPVGARMVVRNPRTEAAILETARGGILRRGVAVSRAGAAVITQRQRRSFRRVRHRRPCRPRPDQVLGGGGRRSGRPAGIERRRFTPACTGSRTR